MCSSSRNHKFVPLGSGEPEVFFGFGRRSLLEWNAGHTSEDSRLRIVGPYGSQYDLFGENSNGKENANREEVLYFNRTLLMVPSLMS
jgi:hypothetical protein